MLVPRILSMLLQTPERLWTIGKDSISTVKESYWSNLIKMGHKIADDNSYPVNKYFNLLPSGHRYRTMTFRDTRFQKDFCPESEWKFKWKFWNVQVLIVCLLSFQKVCRIYFFSWMSERDVTFCSQILIGCPDHCKFCFCWRLFETV